MIRYLHIENFKAIKRISLGLGNLNLFFGMNGMGKSSVIQSVLLCRQSYWKNGKQNMDRLFINGDLISLGTSKEILCSSSDDNVIMFKYGYSGDVYDDFQFRVEPSMGLENSLKRINVDDNVFYNGSIFSDDFHYLSAEHIGPKRKYDYSMWTDDCLNNIGIKGQYVVPFLAMNGDTILVPDELCIDSGRTNKLTDQASAWLNKISPGIRLGAELIGKDQEARLNISYEEERLMSEAYSPINVGFGISYVLPVIVSLLVAKKDSLILIENPESHLHPKGQSAIAELMSKSASYGAQIICESHSDHIINGARVAVKEKIIDNEDVTVTYFSKDINMNTKTSNILIDKNGNLDEYPEGLLDEWGNLMSRLL